MKKLLLLLLLSSVAVNAAWLLGYLRPSSTVKTIARPVVVTRSVAASASPSSTLAAALASGDEAALAAAGFSPDDIRAFKLGRITRDYFDVMRQNRPQNAMGQYWRNSNLNFNKLTPEQRIAMNKVQRELAEGLRAAYGDEDLFGSGTKLGFIAPDKRDKIYKIQADYAEMTQEIQANSRDLQLPADKAKLKLLEQEKERDITAAMSPAEKEQYDLENSSAAQSIRNRYGDAIQSEDVYKKVYALQKAFDDQNNATDGAPKAADASQAQLQKDIKAAIGDDAFAAYQRSNDSDYKTLSALESRLSLPTATADQVYASRDTYAAQSQQIANNADLSAQQRKDQLAAVATQAQADLVAKLGQEGADAYAAKASWMQMLKNGNAFSTSAGDAPLNQYGGTTVSRYRPAAAGK